MIKKFRDIVLLALLLCNATLPAQLAPIHKIAATAAARELFLIQALIPGNTNVKSECAGPGKTMYACSINSKEIFFQSSPDEGKTWLPKKTIAPVRGADSAQINYSLPSIACDLSNSPYKKRLYVCWADAKNGVNNKDVFLVYSDDGGDNWTEPILLTYHPNHKSQFDPAMALDANGRIYLSYFDGQNYLNAAQGTDLYLAVSSNGGLLFSYYKVDNLPAQASAFNEGITITNNNRIELRWTYQDKKNKISEFMVLFNDSLLQAYNRLGAGDDLIFEKTVGFSSQIKIPLTLKKSMRLSAAITKPLVPGFEKTVFVNKNFPAGSNNIIVNTASLGLKKDNYILTLYYRGKNTYCWILEE